jgi:hypothetical protein
LNLISKKLIEILFFIKAFNITPCYQNYFVFNKVILFGIWKKSLRMYLQIISMYNTQNLSVCDRPFSRPSDIIQTRDRCH